jgi:hypothetical protein
MSLFREAVIEGITESWDNQQIPDPFVNEFARGQFELAVHLLGYPGSAYDMSDAISLLHAEVRRKVERKALDTP